MASPTTIKSLLPKLSPELREMVYAHIIGWFSKWLPVILLLFIPFFALLLKIFFHRRKMFYMGHFVTALHLHCEDAETEGPSVSFDGLLGHLTARHADTLCVLRLDDAFVGYAALMELCTQCEGLEEIAVAVRADILVSASVASRTF